MSATAIETLNRFVPKRLAERRRASGYTQESLARSIGCSVATIRHYEQGLRQPRLYILTNIANELDCTLATFFGGDR